MNNKIPIWGRIKAMEEHPDVISGLLEPMVTLRGPKGYFDENVTIGKRFTDEQEIYDFVMALKREGKTRYPILGYRIHYEAFLQKEVRLT